MTKIMDGMWEANRRLDGRPLIFQPKYFSSNRVRIILLLACDMHSSVCTIQQCISINCTYIIWTDHWTQGKQSNAWCNDLIYIDIDNLFQYLDTFKKVLISVVFNLNVLYIIITYQFDKGMLYFMSYQSTIQQSILRFQAYI